MKDKEQQEIYQKYMTLAPIPDKILETCKAELSGEGVLETGHRYFSGIDVEQDYEKAVGYYKQAAEQGLADAYFALSICYRLGKGVKADSEQEKILLQKVIEIQRNNLYRIMGLEDEQAQIVGFEIGRRQEKPKSVVAQKQEAVIAETDEKREKVEHVLDADYKKILFEGIIDQLCEQMDITKIIFSDSLDEDRKVCDYRDISQEKDGSVIGWVEKQGKDGCVLHIDGTGTISAPENCQSLFAGFEKAEEIVFGEAFSTKKVTNMNGMFSSCSSLVSVDVSEFDTSNVTSMSCMFSHCESLSKLDVSVFDTSKVMDMNQMFSWCESLSELDVSRFDTSKVTDMDSMFSGCKNLSELDVSGFDTSNVEDMSSMFSMCGNLNQLDVSRFDTSKVRYMYFMFDGCESLSELDVSGFDTSNVKDMSEMFLNCESLSELDVSGFDTSNVEIMSRMFMGCESLSELDVSEFDTSNVEDMSEMFYACNNLGELDVSKFDTSNVTNMDNMFKDCTRLSVLDVSHFDISKVEDGMFDKFEDMFSGCISLPEKYKYFDRALNYSYKEILFEGSEKICNIKEITKIIFSDSLAKKTSACDYRDISEKGDGSIIGWLEKQETDCILHISGKSLVKIRVSNGNALFMGFTGVKEIVFENPFSTEDLTTMSSMFSGCSSLEQVDVSGFFTENVTDMSSMFSACSSLKELNLTGFITKEVNDMRSMFYRCSSLEKLNMSGFDTSKVTDMGFMFSGCSSLKELNMSGFDTSKVTDMGGMFEGCSSLEKLDVSEFVTENVTCMQSMFAGCRSLKELDVSGFSVEKLIEKENMFADCVSLPRKCKRLGGTWIKNWF